MSELTLFVVIFMFVYIFIWGFTDRLREIAIFPGWESRLGRWFDLYNTKYNLDAYHIFKWIPVFGLFIFIAFIDYKVAAFFWLAWGAGQAAGLLTRK